MQKLMINKLKLPVLLPLLFLLIPLISCGANNKPVANKATVSLQILQRVEELQDTLNDLYNAKAVSSEHVLLYEKFIVTSTKTLQVLPSGWEATVKSAWISLKVALPLEKMETKIQITAKLIDALVGAL